MKRHALCLVSSLLAIFLLTPNSARAGLTYEQEVLADNPWTYYRFSETSGTTAADTATGIPARAGTYVGGVGMTAAGPFGGVLGPAKSFNGTSAYVDVPNLGGPTNTQFTIETWIKPGGYPSGLYALYASDPWATGSLHANFTGSNLEMAVNGNFSSPWPTQNLGAVMPVGSWNHLVVTYDLPAGAAKFFVNGQLVGTQATSGPNGVVFGPANIASWGTSRFLGADLDEFAIYQGTILSASRVAAHYNAAAGFSLVETGGPLSAGNVAGQMAGATAFGKDVLGGTHTIAEVNDGLFGNESSWIGATNPSFVGVAFSGGAKTIDHIGWGRSNTQSHTDRDEGTYTIQYTQVASPGTGTTYTGNPTTGWATLGTSVYDATSPTTPHLRHLYRFPAVNATGVRIATQSTGLEIAIDEIEAYNGHPLTLVQTGGTFDTNPLTPNLARRPGATAFAPDSFGAPHSIAGLNDGVYGNSNSWIGTNGDNTFAGVALGGVFPVDRVAFGRDNGGEATVFTDRTQGTYTLQYTTVANPNAGTPDSDWTTVGTLIYPDFYQNSLRHLYQFNTVYASGLRLVLDAADNTRQIAIDEFEIYQAVPEPSTWVLATLGAAGLGLVSLRRRRSR